jgi:hypothetical protein
MRTHVVIPDTQAKPGVPVDHLGWAGQYIVDKFAEKDIVIVHVGDHADMPSLSSYDKGTRSMEGRRVEADLRAANAAWAVLNTPLQSYQNRQIEACRRAKKKVEFWNPPKHITLGNHEYRIERACEDDAQLEGLLRLDALDYERTGWTVHPFLEVVNIDGVNYSHYFANPMSGRPYGGSNVETRLKTIGASFTMGHQQGLLIGMRYVMGRSQHGLVAGSFYLHDEDYKGPQGNSHWRGLVVCHQVEGGSYDIMTVSMDYLCRRYEGVSLARFTARRF